MSVLKMPSVEAPPYNANLQQLNNYIDQLANLVAFIAKELQWLVNGNLDVANIRANSITADRLSVDELSAISANLGTITAGIIRGIEIYGSYIATAEGTYPRTEMDVDGDFLAAYYDADVWVKIIPYLGPTMQFNYGSYSGGISFVNGTLGISASNKITVDSWTKLTDGSTNQTMESALASKANAFSGYSGSVSTGTNTMTFSNGILVSVS